MVNVMRGVIQQRRNAQSNDNVWAVHVEWIIGKQVVYGN